MGKRSSKIRTPYYDRYFGQNYYRLLGDNLGEFGRYSRSNNCPVQSPIYVPNNCPVTLPPVIGQSLPLSLPPSFGNCSQPSFGTALPPLTTCLPSSLPSFPQALPTANNCGNSFQLGGGNDFSQRPVFFPQAQQSLPQLSQPSFALQPQNPVLQLSQPSCVSQPSVGIQQSYGTFPSVGTQQVLGFQQSFGAVPSFGTHVQQLIAEPTYLLQTQQPIASSCQPQFTQPPFTIIRQSNQPHNVQKRRGSDNSFNSRVSSNIKEYLIPLNKYQTVQQQTVSTSVPPPPPNVAQNH
jgi:hypothetical protein